MHRYVVTPGVGQVFFSPDQLQLIGQVAGAGGRVELNAFMQLIVHTAEPNPEGQQSRLQAAGLGVYPAGPVVKNIQTCTFCSGERAAGLPDAQRLDQAVAGTPTPFPVRIGFSGCTANCAEALLRDVGVVRLDNGRYDIYIGGKTGSLTPAFGRLAAEQIDSNGLVPVVEALLRTYRETAKGRERLWRNIERNGLKAYIEAANQALKGRP